MALLAAFMISTISASAAEGWLTDYATAVAQAKKEGKVVLLDFTGSTWCPPCMLMKKRVFESDEFKRYAAEKLVLLELDFPQEVSDGDAVVAKNLALANQFGIVDPVLGGPAFPTLVLMRPGSVKIAVQRGAFFEPAQFIQWANVSLEAMK
jgi:thiol-disulfide isomerase/thioredoxin